jgi:uncharacterized protein (TIGR01777 family)
MARVLITGGTGLIGRHLCKALQKKGYEVALLSRTRNIQVEIPAYTWDLNKNEIEDEAVATADYIIHLAGSNIGSKRWTSKRKRLINESRINTGQLIFNKVKKQNKELKAFISASAVGYYGALTSDQIISEPDKHGNDFIGETCNRWEQMADRFTELGIRSVKIRTGVVLTKRGGALSKIIIPIKMGIGLVMGNGKQYLSWIHIDDLCAIYIKAIEDSNMVGSYNAVAPEYITNKEFIKNTARILGRPCWLTNIPDFAMKLIFGRMSEILLKGSRISSDKIRAAGYKFLYPSLESALKQLDI